MSSYDDYARKVAQDAAAGRNGFDADAARRMSALERQNYEAAWKNANK